MHDANNVLSDLREFQMISEPLVEATTRRTRDVISVRASRFDLASPGKFAGGAAKEKKVVRTKMT